MKHLRLSVTTRNAQVIAKVKNGATSAELSAEYGVQWDTIRDSIRDSHYSVRTRPANMARYKEFLAKVKANDATAAVKAQNLANVSKSQASSTKKDTDKSGVTPVPVLKTTVATSATTAAIKKPCIILVETGVLLHLGVDKLLTMDEGNNVYWIPRFCIKELIRISESPQRANDPIQDKAKTALYELYAEGVWKVRFIPFEPVEQGMIPKSPDVRDYKPRSFGVAEAALELYIGSNDSNVHVNVLTTSMEIEHLITRTVKTENLVSDITVTRIFVNKK